MNRIERLSAILIQLQTKKVITAQEIADHFEISLRTVYRDVRALEEAGVPIGAKAGLGYYLVEGYHLPPVMFTKDEAGAMLIAEKLVKNLTDRSTSQLFGSAVNKIRSILHEHDKEYLSSISNQVQVLTQIETRGEEFPNDFLPTLQQAIANSQVIEMEYFSASREEATKRLLEPLGVVFYSFNWHLIAFCKLRGDYRDFRVDRIKSVSVTEENYSPNKRDSLEAYFNRIAKKTRMMDAVVVFPPEIAKYLQTVKYYFGFLRERETNDGIEMHFAFETFDYIGNWLLGFGKNVKIISPPSLKEFVVNQTKELAEHYLG